MTTILFKRGTTEKNDQYTGQLGEITIDTDTVHIRVHDRSTRGGIVQINKDDIPTKTSQLTNDNNSYSKSTKVNVSSLTDDVGIWKASELTKVSQLTNDSGYKTGYCSYCTYCQAIQCTTVNCTKCSKCNTQEFSHCQSSNCSKCNYDNNWTND